MGGITITTNMRLFMIPSYKPTSYNRLLVSSFGRKPSKVWCKGSTAAAPVTGLDHPSSHVQHDHPRRSANYGPTVWDFNYLQSLNSEYTNERGDFNTSLGDDTKGLLQLYEASFLSTPGEKSLELAREFATISLQKIFDENMDDENLALLVRHALELPIHWRVQRPNTRWFIEAYERRADANPLLLELAKLDFNIVQATHQHELKHVYEWWKQTGLAEKLPFARDRMVECYFWAIGFLFHPQYGYARIITAKAIALVLVIDDIFDVYGTPEELQLFNNAIQRWDVEAIDQLPSYMQICYLALCNFINETAYDWEDFCQACLQEAEWYLGGYAPTLEEYMNNAWISASVPVVLFHAYFLVTNPTGEEAVRSLHKYHGIVRFSAMILRLANDLATSPCYMNESGGSREEGIEYARIVLDETWKKMNEEAIATDSPFPQHVVRIAFDVGRMAQHMYLQGDERGTLSPQINDSIATSLFQPIR
ncbi:UNVERIFIED_CONTAM: (-)-alpha-terpineol synthase [Sesamum radiatum]|uniref:(-)-alpha-terpineol synthase n=1 Tax=Sesamum radiatum TaxID=300843 RepID=A0AAW2MWW3_SESRA